MIDFFAIFSKSGIVLWCFQSTAGLFTPAINGLIKSVIIPEKITNKPYEFENFKLQFRLDNEFEMVYVVLYQKILMLNYMDKLLNEIHLKFRDKYKNKLEKGLLFFNYEFTSEFDDILYMVEDNNKSYAMQGTIETKPLMKSFQESEKSKKTVESLVENKQTIMAKAEREKKRHINQEEIKPKTLNKKVDIKSVDNKLNTNVANVHDLKEKLPDVPNEDLIAKNRELFFSKKLGQVESGKTKKVVGSTANKTKKKEARIWDNHGNEKDLDILDFSSSSKENKVKNGNQSLKTDDANETIPTDKFGGREVVGRMKGDLKSIEIREEPIAHVSNGLDGYDNSSSEGEESNEPVKKANLSHKSQSIEDNKRGLFSAFKSLVSTSKVVSKADIEPMMDGLKQHLIAKNVAAEVATKLCDSVALNLEGKVLGTFTSLKSTVNAALEESLGKILSPNRRINVLRDVMEVRGSGAPYVITFCGVNGVGKSTNLAKIAFWLMENEYRVLIAACDTFRSGAVEQLRTHARHLNALHPPPGGTGPFRLQLFEKGYGKDAAGLANEAIAYAKENGFDVVLVDTAGRMQDNEPLMRALAKLMKVNRPHLVLFVGEALVGNEATDQLIKFNRALADFADHNDKQPRLIDGILLTKFDTIDDKVGAAISMTYVSGQPIVFVGTGQRYTDLRNLDPKSVIHSLMKS